MEIFKVKPVIEKILDVNQIVLQVTKIRPIIKTDILIF